MTIENPKIIKRKAKKIVKDSIPQLRRNEVTDFNSAGLLHIKKGGTHGKSMALGTCNNCRIKNNCQIYADLVKKNLPVYQIKYCPEIRNIYINAMRDMNEPAVYLMSSIAELKSKSLMESLEEDTLRVKYGELLSLLEKSEDPVLRDTLKDTLNEMNKLLSSDRSLKIKELELGFAKVLVGSKLISDRGHFTSYNKNLHDRDDLVIESNIIDEDIIE